jgi:hypothetical protein
LAVQYGFSSPSPTFSFNTYKKIEDKLQIEEIEVSPGVARCLVYYHDGCWMWLHKELDKTS